MPAIGDTIWIFDQNRCFYKPGEKGGPIWREHWRPEIITGETRVSWVTQWGAKINKKAPGNGVAFSQEQIDRAAFVHDNAHVIAGRVRQCRDYDLMKAIADLLDAHEAALFPHPNT